MEDQRFDDLVKRAVSTSRRQVLGSLLGGLAAALGIREGDAAKKGRNKQRNKQRRQNDARAAAKSAKKCGGQPCEAGNTCLTGGGKPVCCPNARVCGQVCLSTACAAPCQVCDPTTGACGNANGVPCDDNNACTENTTCLNGLCQGGTAVACDDNNPCTINSCDPATGCVYPNAPDTTTTCGPNQVCCSGACCAAGSTCVNGACQAGVCTPGTREVCGNGSPWFPNCQPSGCSTFCVCAPTTEGTPFCGNVVSCSVGPGNDCSSSSQCDQAAGEACVVLVPDSPSTYSCNCLTGCAKPCSFWCGSSAA